MAGIPYLCGMELFFRQIGSGQDIVILHGLFGSCDNWQTFAKSLSEKGFRVTTVDLRNHGQSPHDPEFNYQIIARDVHQLIERHCTGPVYAAGHSMGGKVVMKLAAMYPEVLRGISVIDIAPRYYPPHHQVILKALKSVDTETLKSRGEADSILQNLITDFGTRQFLLKNLYWKEKERLDWRFNLNVIESSIEEVGAATIPNNPCSVPALFVAGENSHYIESSDKKMILNHFPNADIVTAPGAGHWVHADQPAWLLEALIEHIKTLD